MLRVSRDVFACHSFLTGERQGFLTQKVNMGVDYEFL
jgi:hypothetical protein